MISTHQTLGTPASSIRRFGSRGHSSAMATSSGGRYSRVWSYDGASDDLFVIAPVVEHVKNGKALTAVGRRMMRDTSK